jgi:hypothetical protein
MTTMAMALARRDARPPRKSAAPYIAAEVRARTTSIEEFKFDNHTADTL